MKSVGSEPWDLSPPCALVKAGGCSKGQRGLFGAEKGSFLGETRRDILSLIRMFSPQEVMFILPETPLRKPSRPDWVVVAQIHRFKYP